MKHFFPLALVAVMSSFLFSCEKELVEPALNESIVSEKNTNSCKNYSYFNKTIGIINFGKPNGKAVFVGFVAGTSLETQKLILRRYPQFDNIVGEFGLESGVLTRVKLIDGSTCFDTEKFMAKVLKEPKVLSVNPIFSDNENDPNSTETGLTNEFMVNIEGSGTMQQLQKYMAKTNTKLVFSFDDYVHVLSADKYSKGSILEICTAFNKQTFITEAVPNNTFSIMFPIEQRSSMKAQTSKSLGIDAFNSRINK